MCLSDDVYLFILYALLSTSSMYSAISHYITKTFDIITQNHMFIR